MQQLKNDIYLAEKLSGNRLNDCRRQFNQVLSGGGMGRNLVDGTVKVVKKVIGTPGKIMEWRQRRMERKKAEHCRQCNEEGGKSYVVGIDEVKDLKDVLETMTAKVHAIIARHHLQEEYRRSRE